MVLVFALCVMLSVGVMLSHSVSRSQTYVTPLSDGILNRGFLPSQAPWQGQWPWPLLSFFFPRSCPSPQGWMHRGPNNPLLYVPAVRFDAPHLHQSLAHMMNRRQRLSLIAAEWLVGEKKLTSCLLSKHTKTGLSLKSLCRFKGALHLFLMWKSVYFPPAEHYCCVMSFVALMGAFRRLKKIAPMMSSGLFIYVRLNRVREDLTNETEDWVTFEADVFELDPQWAPGVRVSGSLPYWF